MCFFFALSLSLSLFSFFFFFFFFFVRLVRFNDSLASFVSYRWRLAVPKDFITPLPLLCHRKLISIQSHFQRYHSAFQFHWVWKMLRCFSGLIKLEQSFRIGWKCPRNQTETCQKHHHRPKIIKCCLEGIKLPLKSSKNSNNRSELVRKASKKCPKNQTEQNLAKNIIIAQRLSKNCLEAIKIHLKSSKHSNNRSELAKK